MQRIINELHRIRQRSRLMLLTLGLSQAIAWTIGLAVLLILADYLVRFPSSMRFVFLAIGVGVLAWWLWTTLRTSFGFAPSLTELALRVERRIPGVAGRLASSVEFAMANLDQTNPLAERSVRDATTRMTGHRVSTVIDNAPLYRRLGITTAIIAIAALGILLQPTMAATGVKRLLMPYGATQWPARTAVESLMRETVRDGMVHPRGQALLLRARNLTENGEDEDVKALYRVTRDGMTGAWERIVLTHQGGGVHERLVDADAEAIEVAFATADAQTTPETVTLVPPPAIESAMITITPPAYARQLYPVIDAALGPGIDDRAVTPTPALVGSTAAMTITLNKALPVPSDDDARSAWLATTVDGHAGKPIEITVAPDGASDDVWRLTWVVKDTETLRMNLVDGYGLENDETITYRIQAIDDVPPTATITTPETDDIVLPTAIVDLVADARDDVGLTSLALEATVQRATAPTSDGDGHDDEDGPAWSSSKSISAVAATIEAPLSIASVGAVEGDTVLVTAIAQDVYELDGASHDAMRSPVRRLRVISEVDFSTQMRRQLSAVRQNAIRIEAMQSELQDDIIDAGVQPGVARAQSELAERLAAQRESVDDIRDRLDANQLDDQQLRDLLDQSGNLLDFAGRAANRAMQEIEARERQTEASPRRDGATRDPDRNADNASDGPKADESGERRGTSDDPRRDRSDQASSGSDERGSSTEPSGRTDTANADSTEVSSDEAMDADDETFLDLPPEAREEDQSIVDAQQEVREELADLIELLDRDEDTWLMTRQLEALQEEQAGLQRETSELGERTLGQSREELSPEDAAAVEQLADAQRELSERVEQLTDELRDRAEALEAVDPESADGMRRAANTADQRGLSRDMERASERVDENQTRAAQQAQASARQTLERMLEDIEDSRQARADELLRRLASLIESITRLIVVQENELTTLAQAIEEGDFTGRDRAMIRLNQNTTGVAIEARSAGQEARRLARVLDRAADAQGAAVMSLRAQPRKAEDAQRSEERSLELLHEAKTLAEELEQETEEDELNRKRDELREAYAALIERQIALREETLELAGAGELTRRQLVDARRLGMAEQTLRNDIAEVRDSLPEIAESAIFLHVHRMIDDRAASASDALGRGEVGPDVTDNQLLVADGLQRLMDALEQEQPPPQEFADDGGQAGGGAGNQGEQQLILPVTELKLLRGVQEQIYNQTKTLDARGDLTDATRRARLRDIGQQQRDLLDLGQVILDEMQQRNKPPAIDGNRRDLQPVPDDGADDEGDTTLRPGGRSTPRDEDPMRDGETP